MRPIELIKIVDLLGGCCHVWLCAVVLVVCVFVRSVRVFVQQALVVLSPQFVLAEDGVGLRNLGETLVCAVTPLVSVRVVEHGEVVELVLYLLLRSLGRYSQHGVQVSVLFGWCAGRRDAATAAGT